MTSNRRETTCSEATMWASAIVMVSLLAACPQPTTAAEFCSSTSQCASYMVCQASLIPFTRECKVKACNADSECPGDRQAALQHGNLPGLGGLEWGAGRKHGGTVRVMSDRASTLAMQVRPAWSRGKYWNARAARRSTGSMPGPAVRSTACRVIAGPSRSGRRSTRRRPRVC